MEYNTLCHHFLLLLLVLGNTGANAEYIINITVASTEDLSESCQIQTIPCKTVSRYTNSSTIPCDSGDKFVLSNFIKELNYRKQLSCREIADEQCRTDRDGLTCGACPPDTSLLLGSSNCGQCSNKYLFLILAFALAGIVLLLLLLACNLRVSVGHINAIIFYANVVHVNSTILFPEPGVVDKVLTVFIAWLNLDVGIETCFYNGLDAYTKVLLQFVFPLYLWMLTATAFLLKKFCKGISTTCRCVRGNSLPDLAATLFVLSYAKFVQLIINSISFTLVENEDGSYTHSWRLDASVEYFGLKHTLLFVVAIMFLMLYILPLTLLVLLAPCLQAKSHHCMFRWVRGIKPFLDAYTVPYNDKFHHWTGLMLIIRVLFLIGVAANYRRDPAIAYFVIIMIVGPLGLFVMIKRNHTVYRRALANNLEVVSLLNITILCSINWLLTTTKYENGFYIRLTNYFTYISVGISIVLFVMVFLYQTALHFCPQIFISPAKKRKRKGSDLMIDDQIHNGEVIIHSIELSQTDHLVEPLVELEGTTRSN